MTASFLNPARAAASQAKSVLLKKEITKALTRFRSFIKDYEDDAMSDARARYQGLERGFSAGFLRVPSLLRLKADFIGVSLLGFAGFRSMAAKLFDAASDRDVSELLAWQRKLSREGKANAYRDLCLILKTRIMNGKIVPTPEGAFGWKFMSQVGEGLLDHEFSHLPLGGAALQALLSDYDVQTVLDVGCGAGAQANILKEYGKDVTLNDYGKSVYFDKISSEHEVILGDFCETDFGKTFDCVWASHVLEHQRDVGKFLRKACDVLSDNGIVAISVPPLKNAVVGGHLTLWTPGHLLYNLAINGFDCSDAMVLVYGYNISVIARKSSKPLPDDIAFDKGDVDKLVSAGLLPPFMNEGTDGWDPAIYQIP